MNETFLKLTTEKQNNIINSALAEFASTGYTKTSMNAIAKSAGISKASLFYYFNTKKELYLYLYEYCHEHYIDEVEKMLDTQKKDFFDLYIDYQHRKIKLTKRHPEMFKFIERSESIENDHMSFNLERNKIIKRHPEIFALTNGFNSNDNSEISNDVKQLRKGFIDEGWKTLLSKADMSKFKDDVDIDKLIDILTWSVEGYMNKIISNTATDEDFEKYLLFLKKYLYKDTKNN